MKEYFEKLFLDGQESFQKILAENLKNNVKTFVVTANPETMMIGQNHAAFDSVLKNVHTQIVPDGIGVVKAAGILGYKVKGRVTGVELSQFLIEEADRQGKSIFLFGAKEEVVHTLVQKIQSAYSEIVIAGYANGYEKDKDKIFDQIVEKKPDIVLVALGIPQQELLIEKHYDKFEKGIFVGVGGSFDVLSGTKKRAPEFFIKCNLEWLYRIACEPKRLGRFFTSNIRFIAKIMNMRVMK